MHVTIEHLDHIETVTTTFFGREKKQITPGNFVKLKIELTDAERSVLETRKLWNTVLREIPDPNYARRLQRYKEDCEDFAVEQKMRPLITFFQTPPQPPERTLKTTIADFCNPNGLTTSLASPGEAKSWATELRSYIQKIKDTIDYNASPGTTETFDL